MSDIRVTMPSLTSIEELKQLLDEVWASRVLTNNGVLHNRLESSLSQLFQGTRVSLINNGTIALMLALKALNVRGKVITTPYSFVATANAIVAAGCEPVFVDTAEGSFNLDPSLIDLAYDDNVSAILPVHVYGIPCDNSSIETAAKKRGLKIIYDAAHAFNVKQAGESILKWGDASVLSFHATKVFHTFEGGAVVTRDPETKACVDRLKSFGFDDTGDVTECGINGKLNEVQAAMGLALLGHIDQLIAKRKRWHDLYREQLGKVGGICLPKVPANVEMSFPYFPLLIEDDFPLSRDEFYERFTQKSIFPRKYFYPLITDFSFYKRYAVVSKSRIPNAQRLAERVLCLPLYPDLTENDIHRVCDVAISASKE